jgi:hypothetical protein
VDGVAPFYARRTHAFDPWHFPWEIRLSRIVNDRNCVNLEKVIGSGERGHSY